MPRPEEHSINESAREAGPAEALTSSVAGGELTGSQSGSSKTPGVIIVGGSGEHRLLRPADVAQSEDKTVISKRSGSDSPTPAPGHSHSTKAIGESLLGCRLDHYELVEFVGGGGMGSVFRARDTRLGRDVAVKVLARDQTDDETIRRFGNEAQSAARLDHPNIARVHYVGESGGWNYIVFEFIEGINLRDLVLRDGPLELEDALRYTYAVAEALQHAWEREVVHRDIKPSNLLVTSSGALKLVDMGLARMQQVDSSADDLTASGVTLGTFDYISPEQARDPRMADVRSDIYSLGCTLYFLLTGQPPFPEGTALQKLLSHSQEDPPDVRSIRPELSPKVTALLRKMLAKRPTQRQQSPAEVMHDLIQLGDHLGLRLGVRHQVQLALKEPSFAERSLPIIVPAMLLLAAIILVDRLWPAPESAAMAELPGIRLRPAAAKVIASQDTEAQARASAKKENSSGNAKANGNSDSATIGAANNEASPADELKTDSNTGKSATPATDVSISSTGSGSTNSGSTGTGAGATPMTAAGKPVLTKIVVRPSVDDAPPAGVAYSVADAVELAAITKGITAIQIECNGETLTRPFEVTQPNLEIAAAPGFSPIVVFRPEIGGLVESQRMVRVSAGTTGMLHLSNLEIRLELPNDASSLPWSLFSLSQLQVLYLKDCVVTIVNGATPTPLHYQVSMLEVQPPRMKESMMDPSKDLMAEEIVIQLDRCILRGGADMLRFLDERPCKVVWKEGLFVSPERLVATTGLSSPSKTGRLSLDLEQVTLVAQRGLYQLQRRNDAASQLGLDLRLERCNISTAPDAPWLEFDEGPNLEQLNLEMRGKENRYLRSDQIFVRLHPRGEAPLDFTLEEAQRKRWLDDKASLPTLRAWEMPVAASIPSHEHRKEDYVPSGPLNREHGFTLDSLPTLPPRFSSVRPPNAAAPDQQD